MAYATQRSAHLNTFLGGSSAATDPAFDFPAWLSPSFASPSTSGPAPLSYSTLSALPPPLGRSALGAGGGVGGGGQRPPLPSPSPLPSAPVQLTGAALASLTGGAAPPPLSRSTSPSPVEAQLADMYSRHASLARSSGAPALRLPGALQSLPVNTGSGVGGSSAKQAAERAALALSRTREARTLLSSSARARGAAGALSAAALVTEVDAAGTLDLSGRL